MEEQHDHSLPPFLSSRWYSLNWHAPMWAYAVLHAGHILMFFHELLFTQKVCKHMALGVR